MKYNETFRTNNNPFIFNGVTGRLSFILNKKRFLDIIGEKDKALLGAVCASSVIFIWNLQTNFLATQNSPQMVILSVGYFLIYLFLYLKKGQITGAKTNKE